VAADTSQHSPLYGRVNWICKAAWPISRYRSGLAELVRSNPAIPPPKTESSFRLVFCESGCGGSGSCMPLEPNLRAALNGECPRLHRGKLNSWRLSESVNIFGRRIWIKTGIATASPTAHASTFAGKRSYFKRRSCIADVARGAQSTRHSTRCNE